MLVRILGGMCAAIFAALVLDVLWGVFARQVLNDQPAWTEELARFLLVWLALLGGVLAYVEDRHLGVDALITRVPAETKRIARVISHGVVFAFSLMVLTYGGFELLSARWESGQEMPAMGIRKAWFYVVLPLCGVMLVILSATKLVQTFRCGPESCGEVSS